ncbi:MAG: hypothetical protein WCA49_16505, partial [Candidatus Sulfotelmatobacter sp.]
YSRLGRRLTNKSWLVVPSPFSFISSVSVVSALVVLGSFNVSVWIPLSLLGAAVTSPLWIPILIILVYADLVLAEKAPLLVLFGIPYWRGPEVRLFFSRRQVARVNFRKFMKGSAYLIGYLPFAAMAVCLPQLIVLGILSAWARAVFTPQYYGKMLLVLTVGAFLYPTSVLATWLVARPASFLFMYSQDVPTPEVLRLTAFRNLFEIFEESSNARLMDDSDRERARSEWRKGIIEMRKQEASIRKLSENVYHSYLKERIAINLEPLYRILQEPEDHRELECLDAFTQGRPLSGLNGSAAMEKGA